LNNDDQGRPSPPKPATDLLSQSTSVADQEPPSNEAQGEPKSGSEKVSDGSSHLNETRTYTNHEIKTIVDTVIALNDRVRTLEREIMSLRTQNEELEKRLKSQILTLRPAVTTHGTLVVHNRTNSDQHLWVNGTLRLIPATETAEIRVPTGKVTTKYRGEKTKTWILAAPRYKESIEIVQQSPPAGNVEYPTYELPHAPPMVNGYYFP